MTGSSDDGADRNQSADDVDVNLHITEVDRIFDILETALTTDRFDSDQTDQLLGVIEKAVTSPGDTDPEQLAEFVSMLEQLVTEPGDLEEANVEGILSLFEDALSSVSGDEHTADVFSVIEAAVSDPASVTPEDVERFRSGIEQSIVEMTGPYTGELGQLFGLAGTEFDQDDLDSEEFETIRIARLAVAMAQRATGYSMESGVRAGTRMVYAAMNAQSPAGLLTQARAITLDELQRSGIDIGEERSQWLALHEEQLVDTRPLTAEGLRERGERLLSKSAEVGRDEAFHPAYPRILDELAADEARILRLLAEQGTQACLDVYDKRYIPFKSTVVARNLSMVGSDAGCRHPERAPIYLQNLRRLGLIRFTDEPVEDLKRYQVLDAQPHIEKAIGNAKRPKTTYGTIQLSELGIDFCTVCLPVDVNHAKQRRRFRGEPPEKDGR